MSTTWRKELAETMAATGDEGPIIAMAPDDAAFDCKFDPGYGGAEGPAVAAWTPTRVYFPICYDGAEWLGSAPRNPTPDGLAHQGGG